MTHENPSTRAIHLEFHLEGSVGGPETREMHETGGAAVEVGSRGSQKSGNKEKRGHSFGRRNDQGKPDVSDMRETKRNERYSASELSWGFLTEAASLTLGLEQAENVIDPDCWWKSLR